MKTNRMILALISLHKLIVGRIFLIFPDINKSFTSLISQTESLGTACFVTASLREQVFVKLLTKHNLPFGR